MLWVLILPWSSTIDQPSRRVIEQASRRAVIGGICSLVGHPRELAAFPPPIGNVDDLVPAVQCRARLQLRRDDVARAGPAFDWLSLQRELRQMPFTLPGKADVLVGSGFKGKRHRDTQAPPQPAQCLKATNVSLTAAIDKYYASLRYTAELTEADLRFCYVSKAVKQDEDCVRRLYTSDQTYRELLRNDVLTGLQDIESEAGFLSRCKQLLRPGAAGKADGIDCTMIDEAEIKTLLEEALRNFDKLFESINAAEVKRAVEAL